MAFLVHPLVEEKIEVATRRLLERALQVLRNDVGAAMPRAIEVQRFVKQIVAGDAPQHVQHQAALLVEMPIEQIDRIAITVTYDRAAVMIGVLVEIAFAILPDVPRELVGPEILLAPERLEIRREAFVEPCV